jgi:hypothetical protein
MSKQFPPRLMVCEVEGSTPDVKCYMADAKSEYPHNYFKPEFYQEYLSLVEATALVEEARADAWLNAAILAQVCADHKLSPAETVEAFKGRARVYAKKAKSSAGEKEKGKND